MRKVIATILRFLTQRVIKRYQPIVIGVTGSVGKTTTKVAIATVLSGRFQVRSSQKSYNTALSVCFTVLDMPAPIGLVAKLLFPWYLVRTFWLAFGWPRSNYPQVLVLELGADRPGDIEYLVTMVRPVIGVVTAIGAIPVHLEFYTHPQDVASEKSALIRALPPTGLAVLNYDDQAVLAMRSISLAPVITFGLHQEAEAQAIKISYFVDDTKAIGGLSFHIKYRGLSLPAHLPGIIGPHQLYDLLPAVIIADHLGVPMHDAIASFERIPFPPGRMRLLRGIKESIIIDDTYNASPLAVQAGLDALRGFSQASKQLGHHKEQRSIAIIGDMKELGSYSRRAHESVGEFAATFVDRLIAVGPEARAIAEAASKKMPKEHIAWFETSEQAKSHISEMLEVGDIVFVKGSQSMRMERITKALLAEPERASELLVRQTPEWR